MKKIGTVLLILAALQALSAQDRIYSEEDLYKMALETSAAIAGKEAKDRAAAYKVRETGSKAGPSLSFESTMSYLTNPDELTVKAGALGSLPAALGGSPMPATDTTFQLSGNSYFDFKLILDQPVFTWGKLRNALQASREGAAAATLDTMKAKGLIKTEISINCLTLHYLIEIKKAVKSQGELAVRLEKIASDNYANGMIVRSALLDMQAKRRESELAEKKINYQINQVVLNLTTLTGTELTSQMIGTKPFIDEKTDSWEKVYSEAQENNRDLSMLRHSISAEEYKERIQKGDYYFKPDLAFHAELSYSGSNFPLVQNGWNDADKGNLTLTLAIKSPLADTGGLYAASKGSEEDLKAARASYQDSLDRMCLFIRRTLNDMEMNRLNIKYYKDRLDTDNKMIDQKQKEWQSGYGNETDYIREQIAFYSDAILLNREYISLGTSYYKLRSATGNMKL